MLNLHEKRGSCAQFLIAMQRGQHYVPRGCSSFLGRAAENQPHIYMYTAALFLLFVLEQVLHEKKLWFTFFQKFKNSLSSCFLSSLKRRKNYNRSSVLILDYQQTIKNIPSICFIEFFCFPMSVSLSDLFPWAANRCDEEWNILDWSYCDNRFVIIVCFVFECHHWVFFPWN